MSNYTLHHGDCLDILPTLAAQSVDAIITDPPYGTTACKWDSPIPFDDHARYPFDGHARYRGSVWYEDAFLLYHIRNGFTLPEAMTLWNVHKKPGMWSHLKRIIKPRGAIVLFGSQPFTSALVMSNPTQYKYSWVWKHNSPKGQNAKHQPVRIHEDVVVFSDGTCGNGSYKRMTYNPTGLKQIDKIRNEPDGGPTRNHRPGRAFVRRIYTQKYTNYPQSVVYFEGDGAQHQRLHPTQKPLALMEYLVKTYTNEGDTVLDFTFGSGTTGEACVNTGRDFIGIEKDKGYFDIAARRLETAAARMVQMEIAV